MYCTIEETNKAANMLRPETRPLVKAEQAVMTYVTGLKDLSYSHVLQYFRMVTYYLFQADSALLSWLPGRLPNTARIPSSDGCDSLNI